MQIVRHQEWTNWSGSLKFRPDTIAYPESEEQLVELVRHAGQKHQKVRVVGAGHSSMPLVETPQLLVSLEHMNGVLDHDAARCRATILPGMSVGEAGAALLERGLAMHNTGDVDIQLLSGAIGTGTHGSGKTLRNLSWMLAGVRMVTADGGLRTYSLEANPEFIQAARCSLGSLGIFSGLTLQLLPAYRLQRSEWCTCVELALAHADELIARNRHFDMYWYPRSDEVKLRIANEPGQGMDSIPWARRVKQEEGWVSDVLPRHRNLKFNEMEYAIPAEAGLRCFREVRERIRARHRKLVGWRVLYRTVAADDSWLSPFYQRDSVTIALLHNAGLEFWSYFKDMEPIFRAYGGRPHWGKKHTLKADELRPLYPRWDDFQALRRSLDPQGLWTNQYLSEIFGA